VTYWISTRKTQLLSFFFSAHCTPARRIRLVSYDITLSGAFGYIDPVPFFVTEYCCSAILEFPILLLFRPSGMVVPLYDILMAFFQDSDRTYLPPPSRARQLCTFALFGFPPSESWAVIRFFLPVTRIFRIFSRVAVSGAQLLSGHSPLLLSPTIPVAFGGDP